jgi:hypothetical protein
VLTLSICKYSPCRSPYHNQVADIHHSIEQAHPRLQGMSLRRIADNKDHEANDIKTTASISCVAMSSSLKRCGMDRHIGLYPSPDSTGLAFRYPPAPILYSRGRGQGFEPCIVGALELPTRPACDLASTYSATSPRLNITSSPYGIFPVGLIDTPSAYRTVVPRNDHCSVSLSTPQSLA